jgi:hypothetical protein
MPALYIAGRVGGGAKNWVRQLECLRAMRGRKEARSARLRAWSKTRTVDRAAAQRRARIKTQGGVTAPAAGRTKKMSQVNALIEVEGPTTRGRSATDHDCRCRQQYGSLSDR